MSFTIWGTKKLIDGGDMSADITQALNMQGARHARLVLNSAATGDRVGSIYIRESRDGSTSENNCSLVNKTSGVTSTSITVSTLTLLDAVVDIETDAQFLIVFFDFTSGTGTLNCWATLKE